jgi:hypothetical protein
MIVTPWSLAAIIMSMKALLRTIARQRRAGRVPGRSGSEIGRG